VPISVSGRRGAGGLVHALRAVGAATEALHGARVGQVLGIRGPYGTDWGLPAPTGADLIIVTGGIGLAPLRPVITHALDDRDRYRSVLVLIGARTPMEVPHDAPR
jgi:anaerobic sulfite reductase subunit B